MSNSKNANGRRFAVVCASNMNRSMEAHNQLLRRKFRVSSFGTSLHVKLPGPSIDRPNVFSFGTPYSQIYDSLYHQDKQLYTDNGLLAMLTRNKNVKEAPQRWQDNVDTFRCDVAITYEDRVFDMLLDDMANRQPTSYQPLYVININTKDNQTEAVVGGNQTVELCTMINKYSEDEWRDHIDEVITKFELSKKKKLGIAIVYY